MRRATLTFAALLPTRVRSRLCVHVSKVLKRARTQASFHLASCGVARFFYWKAQCAGRVARIRAGVQYLNPPVAE